MSRVPPHSAQHRGWAGSIDTSFVLGMTAATFVTRSKRRHNASRIHASNRWFRPMGQAKLNLITKLKYLIACLEEVSRIASLRLRISDAIQGKFSIQEIEKWATSSKSSFASSATDSSASCVMAFTFA